MEVGDVGADVVALHWFPAEDEEVLRPHHHEAHELVAQNLVDLVSRIDGTAETHGVDGALQEDLLLLVSADGHRQQQPLFCCS